MLVRRRQSHDRRQRNWCNVSWNRTDPSQVTLDLGTGSGCIAIAIKKKWPASHVVGVDVSAEALDIARKNSDALGAQVEWRKCDVLASGTTFHGPFDRLSSNPPYVPRSDAFAMPKHVIDHEPHGALFVEDADPLVFYRAIAIRLLVHYPVEARSGSRHITNMQKQWRTYYWIWVTATYVLRRT